MKFEDKIVSLRKKAGLSQEQLAEKLDVTRQTISKWELGQSKPDMDKLTKMSKLFNVNIDELVNNNDFSSYPDNNIVKEGNKEDNNISYEKVMSNNNSKGGNKVLLYILIIILIAACVTLLYRVVVGIKNTKDNMTNSFFGVFDKAFETIDTASNNQITNTNDIIDKVNEDINVSSFNNEFEFWAGNQSGSFLEITISNLITSNKKNKNHQIEFIFDGTNYGTDSEAIKNIKNNLDGRTEYDLSFEYDDDGYINKFIVETIG